MKMKLSARINLNKITRVSDYFLPLDQPNLDFQLLEPPGDLVADKAKKNSQDKDTVRPKLHIDSNNFATLQIGHVYLNPLKAQFIATSIKVEVQLKEGRQFRPSESNGEQGQAQRETTFVEIPIIGSVVNHTKLFSAVQFDRSQSMQNSQPLPLYLLDTTEKVQMHPNETRKEVHIVPNFILRNNLRSPIVVSKMIFPEGL